ncbi:MAG TPA: hypothetical protein PLB62_04125, partial [Candidatus Sumerlaeota bacterium]|nr:hypothetical protein [Candidatus Sumerlaeota bacterium]
ACGGCEQMACRAALTTAAATGPDTHERDGTLGSYDNACLFHGLRVSPIKSYGLKGSKFVKSA